ATFYVSARSLALRPLDAAVTTGLMLSTSGAMFWLPMPETLAFAGASMLVPLVWLAARRGEHDLVTAPLQSLISLSMTVTNWMSGLAASALGLGLRRALRISVVVLLLAAGLSIVQRGRLPPSVFEVHFWSTEQSVRDLRTSRPGDGAALPRSASGGST